MLMRIGRTLAILSFAAVAAHAPTSQAQTYPDRPVRLVSAFPPGGGADILGRIMAQKFTDLWGVGMFVENKTGASGNIGTDFVAKSEPNGYTLLISPNGLTINPTVMKELPFNVVTDLAPIGMVATSPLVLAVNNNVPARNLAELIALAKAQPGKLNFGSSGPGTSQHLAGELINLTANINTVHIPYRSGAAITQALLAGELQMGYVSYNSVEGFVRQGQLRLIATLGGTRDPTVPDLPTLAEAGLPGCEVDIWYAMFAPGKTPPAIIKQLNTDLKRILDEPGMKDALAQKGFNSMYSTPEAMAEVIRKDLARWKVVADRINLRM
jgi:tripartite-type tricarboxylate transporter receptor subunit TctC